MTQPREAVRAGRIAQPPHDPNLAPRLARFRTDLAAAGGPVEALDQGRAGLDVLWRWFVDSHPPSPGWLYDEAKLRETGPLPAWYPRSDYVARSLGPRLLPLADGLAAQVTSILVAGEPDADWVIEKDAFIKGNVPKLRLPGRRPGAVDEQIAGFVHHRHSEPAFYLPSDPMAFVDAFREFGDPGPRSFSQQSAKEAKELLDHVSSGHDARLTQFLDTVAARGGPSGSLDFSRDSLVPLWTWLTSLPLPPSPVPDAEMRRQDPPWWYGFSGIMIGQLLGPDLCLLATGAADYVAEVFFRLLPESSWVLGPSRTGVDFREPLLRVGARTDLAIFDRVPRQMSRNAWAELPVYSGHQIAPIGPTDLRDLVDQFLGYVSQPAPTVSEAEPEPAYTVGLATPKPPAFRGRLLRRLGLGDDAGKDYSAAVSFSDEAAHSSSGRVDRFVRRIAKHDGVDRAFREDRELVYIVAPRLTPAELRGLIDQTWVDSASARRTKAQG